MLSHKSNEEIQWLLDEYRIKHGPVVDSTRALYEKKLREVMSKSRRTQPQTDRTYYREEEDITYIQHRRPQPQQDRGDRAWQELKAMDYVDEPAIVKSQASYRNLSYSRDPLPELHIQKTPENSHLVPVWLQILVFVVVCALLLLVYIHMEPAEPVKRLT